MKQLTEEEYRNIYWEIAKINIKVLGSDSHPIL